MLVCLKSKANPRQVALMAWQSNKIKRVARSTFAAETLQCSNAFDHGSALRSLYDEINLSQNRTSLTIKTDCQSLTDHIKKLTSTCSERRLVAELQVLKEAISSGELGAIHHIPTDLMIADGMTKCKPRLKPRIIMLMKGLAEKD